MGGKGGKGGGCGHLLEAVILYEDGIEGESVREGCYVVGSRAGRAEKVRAPIGGCNIVLGRERRKACGQGGYVVLKWGGEGGKGGKGAGTYWRL